MNPIKLLTGLWFFAWMLFSTCITIPVLILVFAYDIGHPQDGKDRTGSYLNFIWSIGGLKA